MSIKSPVMRYHGGKFRLAPWVMQFFPAHTTYVEPFGGAAGVLLQKPPSTSEVYNDLDSEIYNVFKVLQDPEASEILKKVCMVTPYARREFELAYQESKEPIEQARRTLVRAFMGFGSAGATKGTTGFRIDSARKYGTSADLWDEYPPMIADFCRRLKRVILENKPAIEVIENHDRADTLFFVDPPYAWGTRELRRRAYRHEMSDEQHLELLEKLKVVSGMVVLTAYENNLYSEQLSGWTKHNTSARISAGSGTGTRTECAWLNPACAFACSVRGLFDNEHTNNAVR